MKNIKLKIIAAILVLLGQSSIAQNLPGGNTTSVSPIITDQLPPDFQTGVKVNYTKKTTLLKPVSDPSLVNGLDLPDVSTEITYTDGLARPLQKIAKKAARDYGDIIALTYYDSFSRHNIQPLIYTYLGVNDGSFKKDGYSSQQAFYNNSIATADIAVGDNKNPYSKFLIDDTSLYRKVISFAPGACKVGSNIGVSSKVMANELADGVVLWQYTSAGAPPLSVGTWTDNSLYITEFTDERGKRTREYKDKEGKIILTKKEAVAMPPGNGHVGWICTYFVYDDLGRLRNVISPKAVETIQNISWVISQSTLDNLCFSYDYDGKGRIIWKKLPGKNAERIIYNKNDQPVLYQNAALAANNQWLFTKYDVYGRTIVTGIYYNNFHYSPSDLAQMLNGQLGSSDPFVGFLINTISINSYTPSSSLFSNGDIYTLTYYDGYQNLSGYSYDGTSMALIPAGVNTVIPTMSQNVLGMRTGGYTRVLDGNSLTATWQSYVMYYDSRSRLIQLQSTNYKGGHDTVTTLLDFSGKIAGSWTSQNNPTVSSGQIGNVRVLKQFAYDNNGRLKITYMKVNDEPYARRLNVLNYDKIGSKLGNKTYGVNAEYADYKYRIWGALESINKGFALSGSGNTGTRWGEVLSYDYGFTQTDASMPSGMQWRLNGSNTIQRAYGYSYDAAGRLIQADYNQKDLSGAWSNAVGNYSAQNIQYDANNNITHMEQWGTKQGYSSPFQMDVLDYTYKNGGLSNQLDGTKDNISADYGLGEFTEPNTNATDYSYDNDGNMTADNNKNIVSIQYNYANKPYLINFTNNRSIKFIYDAAGNLLTKQITENGNTNNIDYLGILEYQNNRLSSIQHEEGKVRPVSITGSNGSTQWQYEYDFFIKDHSGNVRSVVTEEPDANWWNPSPNPEDPPAALQRTYDPTNPGNGYTYTGFTVGDINYRVSNELNMALVENATFSNVDSTRGDKIGSTNPNDLKDTELNPDNNTAIGPSILLRVMAGDKITVNTSAYYDEIPGGDYSSNFTPDQLAAALVTALSGSGGYQTLNEAGLAPDLTYNAVNQSRVIDAMQALKNENTADGTRPQAFLNYLLLDENMQVVDGYSGFVQTTNPGSWNELSVPTFSIPLNGYIIVFLSNESRLTVRFDNLSVTHYKGILKEESHYYPYGLTLTSSAVTNYTGNNYWLNSNLLNRKEFSDGSGLSWYNYGARQYDPQIGVWHVADPLGEGTPSVGLYEYCNANPVVFKDPNGKRFKKQDGIGEGLGGGNPYGVVTANDAVGWLYDAAGGTVGRFLGDQLRYDASTGTYYAGIRQISAYDAQKMYGDQTVRQANGSSSVAMPIDPTEMYKASPEKAIATWVRDKNGNISGQYGMLVGNPFDSKDGGKDVTVGYYFGYDNGQPISDENGVNGTFSLQHFPSLDLSGRTNNYIHEVGQDGSMLAAAVPIAIAQSESGYGAAIGASVIATAITYDLTQIKYVTYTLDGPMHMKYVGRTSGYGDPYSIMMQRYYGHHMRALGFTNPTLDESIQGRLGYAAIRGREQQLYDFYVYSGYIMGNSIRPVSINNPLAYSYWMQSNIQFGPLMPFRRY